MPLDTILLVVVVILFFYFLMIRPMRKQVAAQQELRNSLEVGSRVQLSSGIFGSIRHLGDRQAIVELAPGVEVTVLKQAITAVVKSEDEEFEYDDATSAGVVTGDHDLDGLAIEQGDHLDQRDAFEQGDDFFQQDSPEQQEGAEQDGTIQNKGN